MPDGSIWVYDQKHSLQMARTTQAKALCALKSLYCSLKFVAAIPQNEMTNPNGTNITSVCRHIELIH